jgi:hypothetical protein
MPSRPRSNPGCRETPFDELECSGWHPELIPRWKDAVPARYRSYDPSAKVWRFVGQYRALAAALLLIYFPGADVPVRFRTPSHPQARAAGSDHIRVLHLCETASVELIEASYRVLARLNHPDAGGSTEAMQAINGAYAALRERVSA